MRSSMKKSPLSLASLAVVALLAACNATTGGGQRPTGPDYTILAAPTVDPVQLLTPLFDRRPLTAATVEEVLRGCFPSMKDIAIKNIAKSWNFKPEPGSLSTMTSGAPSTPYLMYQSNVSVCIPRAASGASIFPAEAFENTMVPEGVSAAVRDDWMAQIARVYARNAHAKVAYALPDGRTRVVDYLNDADSTDKFRPNTGKLRYTQRDVTGPFNETTDLSFSGNGLSLVIPKAYSGSFAKTPFDKP
jgi:hypothetical protein